MTLSEVVQALARHMEISVPRSNNKGRYELLFDGKLEVDLFEYQGHILVWGRIADAPLENNNHEHFFKRMLQCNLTRLRAQKSVLTLGVEDKNAYLYQSMHARSLKENDFLKNFEIFLNELDYWVRVMHESDAQEEIRAPFIIMP